MTIDLIDPTTPLPELLPELRFRLADEKQERGRLRGAPLPPTSWDEALKIAYELSPSQDRELRSAVWAFLRWQSAGTPSTKTPLQVHSEVVRLSEGAVLADVRTAKTLGSLGLVQYAVNRGRSGAARARLYVVNPRGYQVGLIAILAWRPTPKVKPGAVKKAAEMMASEVSPTRAADLATRLLSKDGIDDALFYTWVRLFRGLHRLGLVYLRRDFGKLQADRERLAAAATPAFGEHLAEILGPAGMEQLLTME